MAILLKPHAASQARELEAQLTPEALPQHVAVIMDGNGRWGEGHGMSREYGHRESVDAMRTTVTAADDLNIAFLSLFCFSTENILRPSHEVASLFKLFNDVLDNEPQRLHEKNVRIVTSGRIGLLPDPLPGKFDRASALTASNTGLTLNLCVMYSGRSELFEAVKQIATDARDGRIDLKDLEEEDIRRRLYQPEIPDADLVIRTSGEVRLSNFLLWQMAYSELVFTEVLWPDFSRADFLAALLTYQQRNRRFGQV